MTTNSDDGPELVEIDAETEDLAYVLTLLVKELRPEIDCGGTYEHIVYMLVQLLHEPVHPMEIKDYAKKILDTGKNIKSKH